MTTETQVTLLQWAKDITAATRSGEEMDAVIASRSLDSFVEALLHEPPAEPKEQPLTPESFRN